MRDSGMTVSFASTLDRDRAFWVLFAIILIVFAIIASPNARAGKPPQTIAVIDSSLKSIDTTHLTGQVVYVDFWASWCAPCQQSFPWMKELQKRYGAKGLHIVAVNVNKKPDEARNFLEEKRVAFDVIFDSTGTLAKRYDLKTMPTSFIYDRSGKLRQRHEGYMPNDSIGLDSLVAALIGEKRNP
jgi:cytochrome c biogenesis protein CcmG/thiol:disulfide interchange protein DsbE